MYFKKTAWRNKPFESLIRNHGDITSVHHKHNILNFDNTIEYQILDKTQHCPSSPNGICLTLLWANEQGYKVNLLGSVAFQKDVQLCMIRFLINVHKGEQTPNISENLQSFSNIFLWKKQILKNQ